jgi:hypothetical protein
MRRYTCDNCGSDIDTDMWWVGVDIYAPRDEDDADPENDYEYGAHFDSWACMGAYAWNQERAESITD